MPARVPMIYGWLFPLTLALGWGGTRTALHIHRSKGGQGNWLTMLTVSWCPLLSWLLAFLLSLVEEKP